jgi:hypothetical protein
VTVALAKLDEMLRSAHARNDGEALVELYTLAANQSEEAGDVAAACFYLTHAFVFGLQCGSGAASSLQMRLWEHGREIRPEE